MNKTPTDFVNVQGIASRIMRSLRKNAALGKGVVVRQSTIERAIREGKELIVFQNSKGDWFEITVGEHYGNGA